MKGEKELRYCNYDEIPLLLGANDILKLTGLSRTRVYELMRAYDFPAITIGSRHMVRREKFFHWLDAHERQPK